LKLGDALDQPGQFVVADGVGSGIPGLDIGAAQAVEGLAMELGVIGPDGLETVVQGLCLGAQHGDAVALGAVQGQHQQDAVIERLHGLMQGENRQLKVRNIAVGLIADQEVACLGKPLLVVLLGFGLDLFRGKGLGRWPAGVLGLRRA